MVSRRAPGARRGSRMGLVGIHPGLYHLHDDADVQVSAAGGDRGRTAQGGPGAPIIPSEVPPPSVTPPSVTPLDGCVVRMVDPARVADTRRRLLDLDEAERLGVLFRLLGDRSRVRILFALAEAGELCVCDLAAPVHVPRTGGSQALRLPPPPA